MIKKGISVINDFSGGQDTKTPIISMGLNKSPNMRNFHCAGIKERLVKRGGYAKINDIVVDSDNLDTHYPPGYQTYDYPLRTTAAYTEIAQGFKPSTSSTVVRVKLWLKKVGAPGGTDTVTLEIQTDSNGIPSGTAVANGTSVAVDISDTITTSYAWVTFTFASAVTLVSGTQYHLVLTGAFTVSDSAYIVWGADNFDVIYMNGAMSKYDSSIWTADTNYNACFEVYITGGVKGNDGIALYDFASKSMMLGVFGTSLYKMDKNSIGSPDGTWDNIIIGSTTSGGIDYFEYTSDINAQAAYVTNYAEGTELVTNGTAWTGASGATPPNNWTDSGLATYEIVSEALKVINASGYASLRQSITVVTGQKYNVSVALKNGDCVSGVRFQAGSTAGGNQYGSETDTGTSGFTTHTFSFTATGTTLYLEVQPLMGAAGQFAYVDTCSVKVVALQSYSESSLVNQGSYSLKFVASTSSNTKTLTRTIGSTIDLTGKTTIYFDVYASRTGANFKIGIHDSGGTTSEKTYTVVAANTWETVTWDISAVANADKNAIDSIVITILNADALNVVYLDNMYAVVTGTESNLSSSRFWTFADWQSGRALINTDIGLYTYTGTGNATSVAAAPLGKFVVIFRNYVFMAGIQGLPNTIRYSDLSDYTTWTAANVLTVNTNDGDVITGMRILKGKLYIFKRYSIHRVSYLGSNPTFQVDQILGVGCPAHYTIKEVELGNDVGTVLIFLTTDKKLAVFDGYNVQIINDNLTEETNDLFGTADDQPITFSDMNLTYSDLFHAVVKTDTSEYILYCILGTDTTIAYAFVFDYKTGGIYPYDNQVFSASCYAISTNKTKILYCAGYSGYMWQLESGNSDDGSAISAYWVSAKIKPQSVSLLMRGLKLGIHIKEAYSLSTLNAYFQLRIDWNISWTSAEAFAYNRADVLTFGRTAEFEIGSIQNMLQIKIYDNSTQLPISLYGIDLFGEPALGASIGERATA